MEDKKNGCSGPSSYVRKDKQELGGIDSVWKRIVELEGEAFYTATGLPFTYQVIDDHQIKPYREGKSEWTISKALIERAMEQPRWGGKEFNKAITAPSYVAAILKDRRLGEQ